MIDLDFFGGDVSWLFALTQWLGEGEILKNSSWKLSLWMAFYFMVPNNNRAVTIWDQRVFHFVDFLRVERLEMTCFNLSGFYWVQTIIERDSCAITYYRGVEWRKMSGVKNIIFRCYILLFSTDGLGGHKYFSISLHILCEVPRSFSLNSYSVY